MFSPMSGTDRALKTRLRVAASEQPRLPRYRYETVKRPARGASLHHLDTSFYQISTSIPRLARTARVSDTVLYQLHVPATSVPSEKRLVQ